MHQEISKKGRGFFEISYPLNCLVSDWSVFLICTLTVVILNYDFQPKSEPLQPKIWKLLNEVQNLYLLTTFVF